MTEQNKNQTQEKLYEEKNEFKYIVIEGLYRVKITIDDFLGRKNQRMVITRFAGDNIQFDPDEFIPKQVKYDEQSYPDLYNYICEMFTYEEAEKIKKYLEGFPGTKVTIEKGYIPLDTYWLPYSTCTVMDDFDSYLFFESEHYPLDIKICGDHYYDWCDN